MSSGDGGESFSPSAAVAFLPASYFNPKAPLAGGGSSDFGKSRPVLTCYVQVDRAATARTCLPRRTDSRSKSLGEPFLARTAPSPRYRPERRKGVAVGTNVSWKLARYSSVFAPRASRAPKKLSSILLRLSPTGDNLPHVRSLALSRRAPFSFLRRGSRALLAMHAFLLLPELSQFLSATRRSRCTRDVSLNRWGVAREGAGGGSRRKITLLNKHMFILAIF